jgi:NTP pyrophosphatase (non-canonical NTP hydrolase)
MVSGKTMVHVTEFFGVHKEAVLDIKPTKVKVRVHVPDRNSPVLKVRTHKDPGFKREGSDLGKISFLNTEDGIVPIPYTKEEFEFDLKMVLRVMLLGKEQIAILNSMLDQELHLDREQKFPKELIGFIDAELAKEYDKLRSFELQHDMDMHHVLSGYLEKELTDPSIQKQLGQLGVEVRNIMLSHNRNLELEEEKKLSTLVSRIIDETLKKIIREKNLTYENFLGRVMDTFAAVVDDILRSRMPEVLSNSISHVAKAREIVMTQHEFYVDFYMLNGRTNANYLFQNNNLSHLNKLGIEVSGQFLMGYVFLPHMLHINKEKYFEAFKNEIADMFAYLFDYWESLTHEDGDEPSMLMRQMGLDYKPRFGKKLIVARLSCRLFTYGMAAFQEKRYHTAIKYDLGLMLVMKRDMERIASSRTVEEAKRIYEQEFSPGSDDGEFYVGHIMAHIIGMSIYRTRHPDAQLEVNARGMIQMASGAAGDGKKTVNFGKDMQGGWKHPASSQLDKREIGFVKLRFNDLGSFLKTHKIVILPNLPDEIYMETWRIFKGDENSSGIPTLKMYVDQYNQACKNLGIPPDMRLFTNQFFSRLMKEADRFS